jgi:hypothetical protein
MQSPASAGLCFAGKSLPGSATAFGVFRHHFEQGIPFCPWFPPHPDTAPYRSDVGSLQLCGIAVPIRLRIFLDLR